MVKKKLDKRMKKGLIFLVVVIPFLIINGFIIAWIGTLYPDGVTILGFPFAIEFFTYGLMFALFALICYIFFPTKKRKFDEMRTLG
jgi:uncharacterized membrane protein (DUF485 family)